jgi:diazepam-binding inhibitor (GABA receptor modulator, acyl-CoA-binding protein)
MGLDEDFELAAEAVKALPESISNDDKLKVYGLFKQAKEGDVNTSTSTNLDDLRLNDPSTTHARLYTGRPGFLDQKGRAKWDAWSANKGKHVTYTLVRTKSWALNAHLLAGKSQETAKQEYIALAEELKAKYGT